MKHVFSGERLLLENLLLDGCIGVLFCVSPLLILCFWHDKKAWFLVCCLAVASPESLDFGMLFSSEFLTARKMDSEGSICLLLMVLVLMILRMKSCYK